MKNLLTVFCAMVVFSAGAQTTNWYVDGNLYQTTTCTSGDDVTPPTAPAKHGYTFVGWFDTNIVVGTWAQSGTPSPTNPIEPTFYQDGNLILRAIGTGDNLIADTYNTETGKIIRRIGVKVFDGTEDWTDQISINSRVALKFVDVINNNTAPILVTHGEWAPRSTPGDDNHWRILIGNFFACYTSEPTLADFKQYLADQYAAGTPVTIYYPLATPTEETYTPAQ